MEHILTIMNRLSGFNLNCTSITDKSCILLGEYINKNEGICESLSLVKMDGNKGITKEGKSVVRLIKKLTVVLDSEEN